jgi:hypothetical protein
MQVLICRLIDRPLRPTMLKGFYHETQILSWVQSFVVPPKELHYLYVSYYSLYNFFFFFFSLIQVCLISRLCGCVPL